MKLCECGLIGPELRQNHSPAGGWVCGQGGQCPEGGVHHGNDLDGTVGRAVLSPSSQQDHFWSLGGTALLVPLPTFLPLLARANRLAGDNSHAFDCRFYSATIMNCCMKIAPQHRHNI